MEGDPNIKTVIGEILIDHVGQEFKVSYQAKIDEEGDVSDMNYDLPKDLLEALAMPVTEKIQDKILEDVTRWKR